MKKLVVVAATALAMTGSAFAADMPVKAIAPPPVAFEPWDIDIQLDPERHPLRGYDKELQPDPWLGSAFR